MGADPLRDDLVVRALEAQRHEYETAFKALNEPLQLLIDSGEPAERLEIGRELLTSPETLKRVLGARVLRETWDRRFDALELVTQALQHETEKEVVGWLLSAVAFLGDASALGIVVGLARHDDPWIRDQAASAISHCGAEQRSHSALDALIELADDPHEEVRFSALFELGQWWQAGETDSRVERRLRRALDNGDLRIRGIAVEAFATVAPPTG